MYSTGTNKSFANILISNSAMKLDDVCVHIELSNFKYIRIDVRYHESIGEIVQMYVQYEKRSKAFFSSTQFTCHFDKRVLVTVLFYRTETQ